MSRAATANAGRDGPVAQSQTGPAYQTANRPLLIVGAMAAMVMQVLDTTIANVALPHMQATLSATTDTISWVLTSYVLATAIAMPAAGWMVGRLGIRVVFTGSVIAFTLASILCGLAQSLPQMVLFRVLQGAAGAFLAPLAQTVLLDISSAEERPKMMILFSQGIMLGPIAGPVLGGYITDGASWRWVFLINVPVGIVTALILFTLLPTIKSAHRKFDLVGWLLLGTALATFQLMLDRGPSLDWFDSGEIVIYAVTSAAAFWLAGVHFLRGRNPLFSHDLFHDLNLVLSLGFIFVLGSILLAVMALLPGLLQQIYGYPAIDTGWLMTPRGVGMLIATTVIGKAISKLDPRLAMGIGLFITGISLWMMARWSIDMPAIDIFVAGLVQGLGLSFIFMPMNILAFSTLPIHLRTDGTSVLNLMRNLGSSIGIAVTTVLLSRNIQINHAELGERITQSRLFFDVEQLRAFGNAAETGLSVVDGIVTRQAAMIAYLNDFYMMAWVCWATIPLLFLARASKAGKQSLPDADVPH